MTHEFRPISSPFEVRHREPERREDGSEAVPVVPFKGTGERGQELQTIGHGVALTFRGSFSMVFHVWSYKLSDGKPSGDFFSMVSIIGTGVAGNNFRMMVTGAPFELIASWGNSHCSPTKFGLPSIYLPLNGSQLSIQSSSPLSN